MSSERANIQFFCFNSLIFSFIFSLIMVTESIFFYFKERGKPEYPEKNLSEQSREPTNSAHLWLRAWESNPGHIGGRRVLYHCANPAPLKWDIGRREKSSSAWGRDLAGKKGREPVGILVIPRPSPSPFNVNLWVPAPRPRSACRPLCPKIAWNPDRSESTRGTSLSQRDSKLSHEIEASGQPVQDTTRYAFL